MSNEQARVKPTDQDKADAKAKHKRLFVVTTTIDDGEDGKLAYEVLCRMPRRVEWQRYIDAAQAGKRNKSMVTLFTQCLVWPSLKELADEFEEFPPLETMLPGMFVSVLDEIYEGEGKKLGSGSS